MGKPFLIKCVKGLSLIVLLALGQAVAEKQPNEPKVTLIDGSWNSGEGGPETTQANPLNLALIHILRRRRPLTCRLPWAPDPLKKTHKQKMRPPLQNQQTESTSTMTQ